MKSEQITIKETIEECIYNLLAEHKRNIMLAKQHPNGSMKRHSLLIGNKGIIDSIHLLRRMKEGK